MDHVVANLEGAFKSVRTPKGRGRNLTVDSDVLAHIAQDIFLLTPEDAHFLLPKILKWLCHSQASGVLDTETALTVLQYLGMGTGDTDYEWQAQLVGERAAEYARTADSHLKRKAEDFFGAFSANQATAIVDWLDYVKSWKVYDGEEDEISSAQTYWQSIAQRRGKGSSGNATGK